MYPERVVKALQRARANIQAGHPELALPDLEKSVQKSPKGFDAWFLLGQARALLNEHAEAETCFKKAAVYQPKNAHLWFNLGVGYSSRSLFREAIDCYQKAILNADAVMLDAYHNLGSCLLEVESYDEAAAVFQGLLRHHDSADLQALLGIALQGDGDHAGAIVAYGCALARGMNNYTLNLNFGICHFAQANLAESIRCFEQALALKPGDEVAQDHLARSQREHAAKV
jgi:protein O-GlcNAc transferase